ncbi:hypothetical protein [Ochrovirga pacifica]|uniref:hypothetical protein n=1 Tax=Ochrovirga pacifica TaxID=1042376 RepID=UPI00135F1136|nr:hypothetical protein [Ochrovirga pacifica]
MKKTIQLLGILISFSVFSANPSTDGDDKLNDVPKVNDSLYQPEKVDYNQVKEVFRPNKRVERLLLPSKKSIKKKYTIA